MPKIPLVLGSFLLLLLTCPAQGAITFGLVEGNNGPLRSAEQAHRFAAYLSGQVHEEVSIQTCKDEKALHAWLNRYHMVDLALFSDRYLSRQPPGEFFRLAGYVTPRTPQSLAPEIFVARQGLKPWMLKKLQHGLLAMGNTPQGKSVLAELGILATVPVDTRPEELADLFPSSTSKKELPKPVSLPAAPENKSTSKPILTTATASAQASRPASSAVVSPLPAVTVPQPKSAPNISSEPQPPIADSQPASSAALKNPDKKLPEPEPSVITSVPPPKPTKPEQVKIEVPKPAPVTEIASKVEQPKPAETSEAASQVPSSTKPPVLKSSVEQLSFNVEQVDQGIFAALVRPGGHANSNVFFLVGPEYVIAGGAHMAKQTIDDLLTAIRSVTDKPLRYFILTHHHVGYNYIDFDFPPGIDLIISWQTGKAMDEIRGMTRPILFFSDGLTLKLGEQTVVLTNMGPAHTDGDTLVFLPESGVLFTSDLVYLNSVGYMGDGHMEDWLLALEFIERLGAKKLIPGVGPVGASEQLAEFKDFFQEMVSEVLKHIEQGDSVDETLRTFSLPRYQHLPGYQQFLPVNIRRIYTDLKENFTQ